MIELKGCPFCGGRAKFATVENEYYTQRKTLKDAIFIRQETEFRRSGRKEYNVFLKVQYTVKCTNVRCCARNNVLYHTEAEAIEAWNGRKKR